MLIGVGFHRPHEHVEVKVGSAPDTFSHSLNDIRDRLLVSLSTGRAKRLTPLGIQIDSEAQGSLDRHLPIAKSGIRKDLRLFGLLEREERVADALDILFRQLTVLLAQVFAKGLYH